MAFSDEEGDEHPYMEKVRMRMMVRVMMKERGWFRLCRENVKVRMRKMMMVNKEVEGKKLESQFQQSDSKSLWQGLRMI